MVNTEKPQTKAQAKKYSVAPKEKIKKTPVSTAPKTLAQENKPEQQNVPMKEAPEKAQEAAESKEGKARVNQKKKTRAVVHGKGLPISTKKTIDVCRFIKGKRIGDAIRDLEEVIKLNKAIPMKGEYPHQRGAMGAGRFPQRTAKHIIVLLKSLAGNAQDMTDPVITLAIANQASRPMGRFGRTKKKRTHLEIVAQEKITKEKPHGRTKNR